jgi:hypothetical protein
LSKSLPFIKTYKLRSVISIKLYRFHQDKDEVKKDVSLQTAPGENHFHSKNTGGVHIYVLPDGHVQQQELTGAGKIWANNKNIHRIFGFSLNKIHCLLIFLILSCKF